MLAKECVSYGWQTTRRLSTVAAFCNLCRKGGRMPNQELSPARCAPRLRNILEGGKTL
jgi:hypothetical protein